MILHRLLIEDFRKFSRVVADDIQPGLNVFCGPNEAGKTTMATAVRTVFLEKHRATTLKHLLPWQGSSGQPRIEAVFTVGGDRYILRKHFLSKHRCELLRNGRDRFEGEQAEELLSAMMRFSRPLKGSGTPEQAGVPGLLWITQGQAHDVAAPAGNAALHLRDALAQLSGSRLEGGQDALIASVSRELGELCTPNTRKPTGPLAAAIGSLQQAETELQLLQAQEMQFQDDLDRMGRLQAEHDELTRRQPWDMLEKQAAQARSKMEELRNARSELEQLVLLSDSSREKIALLRERCNESMREAEALATLDAELQRAASAAADAQSQLAILADGLELAREAAAQAQVQYRRALLFDQAVELRAKLGMQQANAARLDDAVAQASGIQQQLQAGLVRAGESQIDAGKVDQLKKAESEIAGLTARMEANGTRIDYRLLAGQQIRLDGEALSGSGDVLLGGRAEIVIEGVGRIAISPGASNMAELTAQHAAKAARRKALLDELTVQTLAEAEQRLAAHRETVRELDNLRKMLHVHAPDGLEALMAAAAAAHRDVQASQARLADLPDLTDAPTMQDAQDTVAECAARLQSIEGRHRTLLAERAELSARANALSDQVRAKRDRMASVAWQERQRNSEAELENNLLSEGVRQHRIEEARKRVEALLLEVTESDVDRFLASARSQRSIHAKQKTDLIALGAKLESAGALGLGERVADGKARVEQLQRRKSELSRRADALAMLLDIMVEERDKSVRQLQAPLLERMDRYFRRLFPQAVLTLNDNLSLTTVSRNGFAAELKQLSLGTQEQLGILARLAYADLLKESGVPTLLLIDDCVVHTDASRRKHVKRALLDAAQRHQILVFTCHPEDWDDLGVMPRNIEDLVIGS